MQLDVYWIQILLFCTDAMKGGFLEHFRLQRRLGAFLKKKVFWFGTGHRGVLGTNDRSLEFSIWPQQPAETNRGIHHWEQEPLPLRLRRLITLIFYMHMKFSAKAFPKHKVWFKKFTKAFMCLKIWSNPLCAYDVLQLKNNWK